MQQAESSSAILYTPRDQLRSGSYYERGVTNAPVLQESKPYV
jgi:hypothetical protein